jgi:hypothetical protein
MAELAAELFSANLVAIPHDPHNATYKSKLLRVRPRKKLGEPCLLIVPSATSLGVLYEIESWHNAFGYTAAWVIDSFWIDRIPWYARYLKHIDQYFVTNPEEIDPWKQVTGIPTSCIPWGSDVLRLGSESVERKIDLIRVGRQPPEWEDDMKNVKACKEMGLTYQGRPPGHTGAYENQSSLMKYFSESKFSLSFSNLVNPTSYTHKTRQYLTGRWLDALASGCIVAGIHPTCEIVNDFMWDGALLDIGTTDRAEGLNGIKEACLSWKEENAMRNYHNSLARLDWRWRFKEISKIMGINCPRLESELDKINTICSEYSSPSNRYNLIRKMN